ncbi:LMBR1 domain-containing protein 2-like protein [Auxenochlorella protothecoides]|uniref:LMBR1 domain-containing protein 2-like protein n=1 Tax=Auxenochlorella protothecoides TaxID=3075 RepID=A0A087SD16_AUXPR|nr:LMBR1 domain-containing protein 2-like protein [Auxenochlorella protothecoides]KFM23620.1 LMBR1 domain-containing protein 2-like protein [Auxenochlorella protothecoides]
MGLVLASVAVMTKRYVAPRISLLSVAITCAAWLTSLSVISLVPIDVYSTVSERPVPALDMLWTISYWSTQVLTWALIPIMQNYVVSGAFSVLKRLGDALHRLWLFYLVIITLCIIGGIVALLTHRLQLSTVPALVVTLSNAYGLFVIIALLGYGLVEVPRTLWRRSFPESRLKWHYHRVGRSAEKLADASTELEKVLAIALATTQQISRSDAHLRPLSDAVVKYLELYSPVHFTVLGRPRVNIDLLDESDLDYASDEAGLTRLRARCKAAIAHFVGCRGEYVINARRAMHLQAALLAVATSATIIWAEATIGSGRSPDLSPFSLAIHTRVARREFLEQLIVAAPLAYMCACTYFSLFKLGNFGFYHMVPGATWSRSLLLSGSLLARFAAPLCYNFLHVIRMNEYLKDGQQMVFIAKMGSAFQDVPILGQSFNTWFPLLLVVYVLLLTFNLWEQCASKFFISEAVRFDVERADDEHSSKGQRLVLAEQDALLRGGAVGDGIDLFGVSGSEGRDPSAAASAGSDRQQVAVQMAMTEKRGRSSPHAAHAAPQIASAGRNKDDVARPASEARIDDLFGDLGGRRAFTPAGTGPGNGEQRLLPPGQTSSSSFSWKLR